MQNVDISFTQLYQETCVNCQLPVTCAPVYVINDLKTICGRCQTFVKDHYRNLAYEAVASIFLYPCKNWENHCSMKLQWNESLQHEPECNYSGCCSFMCSHPGAFFKGKRDIPNDPPQWVMVSDQLLSYLECALCRGYLNNMPVFLQSNGQSICHRCVYANTNPADCRRNLPYERFSQYLLFSCSYKTHGCPERLPFGNAIWEHESQCQYNPHHKKIRESAITRTQTIEDPKQRFNGKQYKEKGVVKTAAGTHIWATITPQQAAQAAQDNVIKDLNQKQRRRVDELENDMNGRRISDSESVSTNESYPATKGSNHSTSSEFINPRRTFESPRRSNSNYSRSDSRDSGQTPKYPPGQTVFTQQPARRPPSPDYYEPPPASRNQYPNHLAEPYDHLRRTSYRESFKRESAIGNPMLISELKFRQDQIKRTHSIKGNGVPYRPNGNSNMNGIREDHVRVG